MDTIGRGQSSTSDVIHLLQEMDKILMRVTTLVESHQQSLADMNVKLFAVERSVAQLRGRIDDLALPNVDAIVNEWPRTEADWITQVKTLFDRVLTPAEQLVCAHLVLDPSPTRVAAKLGKARTTISDQAGDIVEKLDRSYRPNPPLEHAEHIPLFVCSRALAAAVDRLRLPVTIVEIPSKRREDTVVSTERRHG